MARQALFTKQITSLVTEEMRAEIDRMETEFNVSQGDVIRLALEDGQGLSGARRALEARRSLVSADTE